MRWFGPSRDEVWRQLCQEIGADFIEGGWWHGSKVEAHVAPWTITLDSYTISSGHSHQVFTRMRAPYVNPDGFRFTIYRKSLFSDLGKMLGMQDIEIGDPAFDDPFIIKANEEFKARELFAQQKLKDLLLAQPSGRLEVTDDEGWFSTRFPEGVDELRFEVSGDIRQIDRLKGLFDLFAEALDQLTRIGSATRDDPGVTL